MFGWKSMQILPIDIFLSVLKNGQTKVKGLQISYESAQLLKKFYENSTAKRMQVWFWNECFNVMNFIVSKSQCNIITWRLALPSIKDNWQLLKYRIMDHTSYVDDCASCSVQRFCALRFRTNTSKCMVNRFLLACVAGYLQYLSCWKHPAYQQLWNLITSFRFSAAYPSKWLW